MATIAILINSQADANQLVSILDSAGWRNAFPHERVTVGTPACIWSNSKAYSLNWASAVNLADQVIKPNQLAERLKEL